MIKHCTKPSKPWRALLALAALVVSAVASAEENQTMVTHHALSPELALKLAQAALAQCRASDFQVSVVVVDRGGEIQVALRDQLAGNFTYDIAVLKARTAAGFRQSTVELAKREQTQVGLPAIGAMDSVLLVGGGVPVSYNGSVVAAIGVSGAPTPSDDHICGERAVAQIEDELLF